MDKMRALITGPEDTPYYGGAFIFDIYFSGAAPAGAWLGRPPTLPGAAGTACLSLWLQPPPSSVPASGRACL
jgi:hypothetical protein